MSTTTKRLANVKTRVETGFDEVLHSLNTLTPYGAKCVKELKPFTVGREKELTREFDKMDLLAGFVQDYPERMLLLTEYFMEVKEISYTLERSAKNVLSVVELYEIKTFLLMTEKILGILNGMNKKVPIAFRLWDTKDLLNALDPSGERINTFYIYDQFSQRLGELRQERRNVELSIRRIQKETRRHLEQQHGFSMTPKCELLIPKADAAGIELARSIGELVASEEDYMSVTFTIKPNDAVFALQKQMEELDTLIEGEELLIREMLSQKVSAAAEQLAANCGKIGALDFVLAKVYYAKEHGCIRPQVSGDHILEIEEGRHLIVEAVLKEKGKEYCPVSVQLADGVSCITGANMGGKTISLKMIGLVSLMAQYGFFVPCKSAVVGLSNYTHILIGDSQNVQRGLSSFGSEMEELKEILDNAQDRSLLLIDEIASGTNPVEGLALTKGLIRYLLSRRYISVITTHFDHAAVGGRVHNMQVRGLADADFDKLAKELSYANRRERIEIVGKYMDYRLYTVDNEEQIPKDALNIARILGIYDEIIDYAREIMQTDI